MAREGVYCRRCKPGNKSRACEAKHFNKRVLMLETVQNDVQLDYSSPNLKTCCLDVYDKE